MSNYTDRPNHVHVCGDSTFSTGFGALHSVTAVNLTGRGHHAHVDARFKHGLRIELTLDDATELQRQLLVALAKMPILPDVHDAVGGVIDDRPVA